MKGDQDLDLQKTSYECVRFLILSAVRHNTDSNTFNIEIQQIGVPKEHSSALCKVLDENSVKLRKYLEMQTLRINQLEDVKLVPSTAIDCIQLELKVNNEIVEGVSKSVTHHLNIQKDDVKVLLKELKTIRSTMNHLDYENKHSQ